MNTNINLYYLYSWKTQRPSLEMRTFSGRHRTFNDYFSESFEKVDHHSQSAADILLRALLIIISILLLDLINLTYTYTYTYTYTMKLIPSLLLLLSCLTSKLVSAGTNEAGLAFLEENKSKPGVITLPSGLQYKVLKVGSGTSHPTVSSPCSCHYAGTLIDGTTFDSSYDRGQPTTFAPNQVIAGWTEAMVSTII